MCCIKDILSDALIGLDRFIDQYTVAVLSQQFKDIFRRNEGTQESERL